MNRKAFPLLMYISIIFLLEYKAIPIKDGICEKIDKNYKISTEYTSFTEYVTSLKGNGKHIKNLMQKYLLEGKLKFSDIKQSFSEIKIYIFFICIGILFFVVYIALLFCYIKNIGLFKFSSEGNNNFGVIYFLMSVFFMIGVFISSLLGLLHYSK